MKKQCIKRGMSVLSAFIIGFTTVAGLMGSGITSKAATTNISNPRIADDGTVTWDKVTFGRYYDDVTDCKEQAIKWRILSVDDDGQGALLLADKALDCKPYNDVGVDKGMWKDYSCTWETCSLRAWLNEDFYNTAFNADEKALINESNVKNYDYYEYYKNSGYFDYDAGKGGKDTNDNVYLLATQELTSKYGFTGPEEENVGAISETTGYARMNGAEWDYNKRCSWWLRTPGYDNEYASYVGVGGYAGNGTEGDGKEDGVDYVDSVRNASYTVRPVLHVKSLDSLEYAGKVDSNGNEPADNTHSEYRGPVIDGDVTTWECVYFGRYKQDVMFAEKPIEWRVLSVNGNDAFLLADKALDCQSYNTNNSVNTINWETCSLRNWLNYDFYNSAFDITEQEAIKATSIDAATDKMFLLSAEEVTDKQFGFNDNNNEDENESETRQVDATDYAKFLGAADKDYTWPVYRREHSDIDNSTPIDYSYMNMISWWLREGNVMKNGLNGRKLIAVRPAMHVDMTKADLTYAGTVSANLLTQDDADAANVDKLISAIGTVTLNSKSAIEAARTAYDALTYQAKLKVTKYDVLTAAEAKYAELEKQDKEDTANAARVDELISAIGTVTLNSKSAIESARTAYDALTSGAKSKVTKYDVLTAAEAAFAKLQEDANKKDNITPSTTETVNTKVTDAQMKKSIPAVSKVETKKTKKGKASVTIKWKKVNGANGYKIYRSTKKKSGYKCVKTIKKATAKSWKDTGVKTGKKYYYKMRAYKKSGKKTIYSKYSSTKKISVK